MTKQATCTAGRNISMKAPPHVYEETVQVYKDLPGCIGSQLLYHSAAIRWQCFMLDSLRERSRQSSV